MYTIKIWLVGGELMVYKNCTNLMPSAGYLSFVDKDGTEQYTNLPYQAINEVKKA